MLRGQRRLWLILAAFVGLLVIVFLIIMLKNNDRFKGEEEKQLVSYLLDLNTDEVVAPGIKQVSAASFALDTTYKAPNQFAIYYGELAASGVTDYSNYDSLVVSDQDAESISAIRAQGTQVYQYISFGSRFEDTDTFIKSVKETIASFNDKGLADGIFFDECDIAYWDVRYQQDTGKQDRFYKRLQELTAYIQSIGMKSVINGTRSFAELGDYYLWESFLTNWNTNRIHWDASTPLGKSVTTNGAATYGSRFSEWSFGGTAHEENGHVVGGEKGSMEIIIDLDERLDKAARKDAYSWAYTEWQGQGGSDETVSVWAWTGDSLPFDEATWTKLPKLWSGNARSWNGINSSSKYLKLKYEFHGADSLDMEQVMIGFDFNYPYWKMESSNSEVDGNPYMWNFNNNHLNELLAKSSETDSPIRVWTQSYGLPSDEERMTYSYLGSAINGFYAWNYTDPMIQKIEQLDIMDIPLGMLLKREKIGDVTTGQFTGGSASIDAKKHTYTLSVDELDYGGDRIYTIDGDMSDWREEDRIYSHTGPAYSTNQLFWGAHASTFSTGRFDNVKVVKRDGVDVLELIKDGIGTWTSEEQGGNPNQNKKIMLESNWDGGGEGAATYLVQYQLEDGSWTEWSASRTKEDFYQFRVRVELKGKASYETVDPATGDSVFQQGISFWGSSHQWRTYLSNNANITGIWMADTSENLYIRIRAEDEIDFHASDSELSKYFYNLYVDTSDDLSKGFKGSWWHTPTMAANYRLTNGGLYKWNSTFLDQHSNEGWEWVGTADVAFKWSKDRKEIEYKLSKKALDMSSSSELKVYMNAEEASTMNVGFMQPDAFTKEEFDGQLTYSSKSGASIVPHGYVQSGVIKVDKGKRTALIWEEVKAPGTTVKAWIRTRTPNNFTWNDWQQVTNGEAVKENYDRIQYSIGLYTEDSTATPVVSNVKLQVDSASSEKPFILNAAGK